jgi:phage-related protein
MNEALIICSHGFVKKTSKVPKTEIDKALKFRSIYLNQRK